MRIDAVGFDVDGTLYPENHVYRRLALSYLPRLRLILRFGKVRRVIRVTRPIEDFRATQAHMLAGQLRVSPEEAEAVIDRHIYARFAAAFRNVRPFPYAEETLGALRTEGLRLGALSDFPLANKLPYLGLREKFQCVACSEDSGYLKPNPEPFLYLAECLSVRPENMLYVGNNYAYDIVGANAAGMLTAHLSRRPVRDSVADLTRGGGRDDARDVVSVE